VRGDGRGGEGGEEQPDVAGEEGREKVRVGLVGGLGRGAEGFGHDFCFAEEEAVGAVSGGMWMCDVRIWESACEDFVSRRIGLKERAVGERGRANIPRIAELGADLLQVGVAHVLDAEDEDVLILVDGLLDVGEELEGELLALLVDLRQVDDLRALGLGHSGGCRGAR